MTPILSVAEMYAADKLVSERGTPGFVLMERAGIGVAKRALQVMPSGPIAVLCGPGNNGGDGYIAAEYLRQAGRAVTVFYVAAETDLKGDARRAAAAYKGSKAPLEDALKINPINVIDALYGAGLSRPLEGTVLRLAERDWKMCLAVDVPSGVHGDRGIFGPAFRAHHTITFAAPRHAHFLNDSRHQCGQIAWVDIGIGQTVLSDIGTNLFENTPALWRSAYPWPGRETYKHKRGHLFCVTGGPLQTGAARLAAHAGLRVGAGLVTLACPPGAAQISAASVSEVMVLAFSGPPALRELLAKARAVVIGPANGVGPQTAANVLLALQTAAQCVIDADGLTSFEEAPEKLFEALRPSDVLTPHIGEFRRLFPEVLENSVSRIEAVKRAAELAGCVVLLKGPDTVVAEPGGRASINAHASPWLATAGSGDVLAGLIGGLVAQNMNPFLAACAGVWLHGDIGLALGPGLIAGDIVDAVPTALKRLQYLD